MSPISSKNSVPRFAETRRPVRGLSAPVNAPRTCPNSSDSASASGIAAMLTTTNGAGPAMARAVDHPRDDLLAGAGLAADEHARLGARDLIHALEDLLHRRVLADDGDAGSLTRAPARGRLGAGELAHHRVLEDRDVERFRDHVGGAHAQRFDGVGDGALLAEHDRRDRRAARARLLQDRDPVGAGQMHIRHAELERAGAQERDRVGAVVDGDRLVTEGLDQTNEPRVNRGIVVDQQNGALHESLTFIGLFPTVLEQFRCCSHHNTRSRTSRKSGQIRDGPR